MTEMETLQQQEADLWATYRALGAPKSNKDHEDYRMVIRLIQHIQLRIRNIKILKGEVVT